MKYFILIFMFVGFMLPQQMLAAVDPLEGELNEPKELVACKDGGVCNFCDLTQTINNVIRWTVFVSFLIAVILLMYAGYQITYARGDVNKVSQARDTIANVAIGVFILILAWTMIDILLKSTTGGGFGVWNNLNECGVSNKLEPAKKKDVKLENTPGVVIPRTSNNAI